MQFYLGQGVSGRLLVEGAAPAPRSSRLSPLCDCADSLFYLWLGTVRMVHCSNAGPGLGSSQTMQAGSVLTLRLKLSADSP